MKTSTTDHNVANWIAHHVERRFPYLAANPIEGMWFTGSNVWSLLYGTPSPSAEARDWDIFTLTEPSAEKLVTVMGWNRLPSFPTRDKRSKDRELVIDETRIPKLSEQPDDLGIPYSDGYCYVTPDGEVDVWVSPFPDAFGEIRTYPTNSHAHCRAAFSFTEGLIVLPNECAEYGGRIRTLSTPDLDH